MTPREALDRIGALCNDADETNGGLRGWVLADRVRAVLAEVSPEPGGELQASSKPGLELQVGGVLDRDQARAVLRELYPIDLDDDDPVLRADLDRLAGCVRPAAIDRDALTAEAGTATFDDALRDVDDLARVLYEVRESGGWDRAPWADRNYWRGMAAKAIAAGWRRALVRPVAGVWIGPEEARRAAGWYFQQADDIVPDDADRALVAQLEAAS